MTRRNPAETVVAAAKMTSTASKRTVMHRARSLAQALRALLVAFLAVTVTHLATLTPEAADPVLRSATPPPGERAAFDTPTPDAVAARSQARPHAKASGERDSDPNAADPAPLPGTDHAPALLGVVRLGDSPSISPAYLPSVRERAPPGSRST